MLLKKYEKYIQELNQLIQDGSINLEENTPKIQKILEVYKLLQNKDYKNARDIIEEITLDLEIFEDLSDGGFLSSFSYDKKESFSESSNTRGWNTELLEEDNIEVLNSIEFMSGIFLQNLKEKIG